MKNSVVVCVMLSCVTLLITGCDGKPAMSQISGTVTFKGKPIPAGNVMFTPDVSIQGGQVRMFMVTDGAFDSTKDPSPGLLPGKYDVTISGYDGKKIPMYFQGKQIFNAVKEPIEVTVGSTKKDFVVPDSAGTNVKIFETADF